MMNNDLSTLRIIRLGSGGLLNLLLWSEVKEIGALCSHVFLLLAGPCFCWQHLKSWTRSIAQCSSQLKNTNELNRPWNFGAYRVFRYNTLALFHSVNAHWAWPAFPGDIFFNEHTRNVIILLPRGMCHFGKLIFNLINVARTSYRPPSQVKETSADEGCCHATLRIERMDGWWVGGWLVWGLLQWRHSGRLPDTLKFD